MITSKWFAAAMVVIMVAGAIFVGLKACPAVTNAIGSTIPISVGSSLIVLGIIGLFIHWRSTRKDETDIPSLFKAFEEPYNEEVATLLSEIKGKDCTNIDAKNDEGLTVLHRAIALGHRGCVEAAINKDASVLITDSEGNTALHLCYYYDHHFPEVIYNGKDEPNVHAQNDDGKLPWELKGQRIQDNRTHVNTQWNAQMNNLNNVWNNDDDDISS